MVTQQKALVESGRANDLGYKTFRLGGYEFERNAYFTIIRYPGGEYHIPVGEFMRAVQRDIGWNFFYGMVKFDEVFGTFNFYEKGVDMFLGKYNDAWQKSGKHYSEMFPNEKISATFKAILEDWVPPDFNPWAAPR
ncbi:MAG: hydroxyquinol 1,2-dioxygenase, partial [Methanobacteriota archaeon]